MGGRGIVVGGGGIGTLLLLVLIYALGGNLSSAAPGLGGMTIGDPNGTSDPALAQNCQTGADANAREDCRIVAYVNSVQKYWTGEFSAQGQTYVPAQTTFFTGQIQTGCGTASTDVGPFYCPTDKRIWIDLGFFDELQSRTSARGAGRLRRATSSRTNTATTSRTWSGSSTRARRRQGRRADRSAWSSRPTATPGSGRRTP